MQLAHREADVIARPPSGWIEDFHLHGVNLTRAESSRARARSAALMMALAARRELGGGVRQHPGSNNCVEAGQMRSISNTAPPPAATGSDFATALISVTASLSRLMARLEPRQP